MASKKRRRKVRERIADMNDEERRKLYKHAARLRRASSEPRPRAKHRPDYASWSDDDEQLPAPMERRRRRHKGSLRQWAEALVEDGDDGRTERLDGPAPDAAGVVLFATAGHCRVLDDDGLVLECTLASDLATAQRSELAVGDRVRLVTQGGEPTVVALEPRRSVLSRHDAGPGGHRVERVVAANVDLAVVVAAAREPALRPRLLDRYLVAILHGGADALIAVTKVDLLDAGARVALDAVLRPYHELGVPVVSCSATAGIGVDALRTELSGKVAVLVGQSGVGKSSLLNALAPELAIETRSVGQSRKGRHTTTASTLYELAEDTRVIDTPGVREFGLWDLDREELRRYFEEFDDWAAGCRYRDCAHDREPDCAVRAAVESGHLAVARYDSYRRLLASMGGARSGAEPGPHGS